MGANKRFCVLGAGISGLALAWHLKQIHQEKADILLLEKSSRPGGWIQTLHVNGYQFECGPRTLLSCGEKSEVLQLAQQLHLTPIEADPTAKKRFLWYNQKLQPLPRSPKELLFSPLMKGVFREILHDLWTKPCTASDESIEAFFLRRFGKNVAYRLIDPLITGTYAGNIRHLSMRSCFPFLWEAEQKNGSLTLALLKKKKERSTLISFQEWLEALPRALASALGACLHLNEEVLSLSSTPTHMEVTTSRSFYQADAVYSALPIDQVCKLCPQLPLEAIPTTSLAVICLGYPQPLFPQKGFGYLIPTTEKEEILGVVWDSALFPQHNHHPQETRLTVMLGGAHHPHILAQSDQELIAMAQRALQRHLAITLPTEASFCFRAYQAIPQYQVGHFQKVQTLEQIAQSLHPRLHLLGNGFYGVSIGHCLAKARALAQSTQK